MQTYREEKQNCKNKDVYTLNVKNNGDKNILSYLLLVRTQQIKKKKNI